MYSPDTGCQAQHHAPEGQQRMCFCAFAGRDDCRMAVDEAVLLQRKLPTAAKIQ
jgi:hypothetical protein